MEFGRTNRAFNTMLPSVTRCIAGSEAAWLETTCRVVNCLAENENSDGCSHPITFRGPMGGNETSATITVRCGIPFLAKEFRTT